MNKPKQFIIRLTPEIHRLSKLKAYEEAKTLQQWITELIMERLKEKK